MKCCSDYPRTLQCLDCPMYRQVCVEPYESMPFCGRVFYNESDYNHHMMVIHGKIRLEPKSESIKDQE